jgi:hypothetical protein
MEEFVRRIVVDDGREKAQKALRGRAGRKCPFAHDSRRAAERAEKHAGESQPAED